MILNTIAISSIFLNLLVFFIICVNGYSGKVFFLWIISIILCAVCMLIKKYKKIPSKRTTFISLSFLINLSVNILVYQNKYSNILIFLWIISFLLLFIAFLEHPPEVAKKNLSVKYPAILLIILLPLLTRIINTNIFRNHGDEFILAYFSSQYDFEKDNFFSAIPADRGEWVTQFPAVFFVLQKLFFLLFGENFISTKFSIIPFILIISLVLFLIVKKLWGDITATISVILYSFFAISLYHDTLVPMFAASTAVFMIFLYFLILYAGNNKPTLAICAGIFCGISYLFYFSSQCALFFLILFYLFEIISKKKVFFLKHFFLSLIAFLFVVSPFMSYMAHSKNFYFLERYKQVNLINKEAFTGISLTDRLEENFFNSLSSLYSNEKGGSMGFYFGHFAYFEFTSLIIFTTGIIISFFMAGRKREVILFLSVILISFLAMVLTIPPPGYHRTSLAFPFIAIIMSLPFYILLKNAKSKARYPIIIFIVLYLMAYCINNELYFIKASRLDRGRDVKITGYIEENFPQRNIYIAYYPSHHLKKVFHFSKNRNLKKAFSEKPDFFLKTFNSEEKYLYIFEATEQSEARFKSRDKNGKIIKFPEEIDINTGAVLFAN